MRHENRQGRPLQDSRSVDVADGLVEFPGSTLKCWRMGVTYRSVLLRPEAQFQWCLQPRHGPVVCSAEMRPLSWAKNPVVAAGRKPRRIVFASLAFLCTAVCDTQAFGRNRAAVDDSAVTQAANLSATSPSSGTGGFDGVQAYEHVRQLVEIGPRPPGSDGIHRAQAYIIGQLQSFGCQVEEHDFRGSTPLGDIAMKNIIAKIPGTGSDIVLYTTHYDTLRMPNFVGADDGGSGTGAMLELARLFCARKAKIPTSVWIVFFDGEEAQGPVDRQE